MPTGRQAAGLSNGVKTIMDSPDLLSPYRRAVFERDRPSIDMVYNIF